MQIHEMRKRYLIAKALWSYVKTTSENTDDREKLKAAKEMKAILDQDFADLEPVFLSREELVTRFVSPASS